MLFLHFFILISCLSNALSALIRDDKSYEEPNLRQSIEPIESRISKPLFVTQHEAQPNVQFHHHFQNDFKIQAIPHPPAPLGPQQLKNNLAFQPLLMNGLELGEDLPTHHLRKPKTKTAPVTTKVVNRKLSMREAPNAAVETSIEKGNDAVPPKVATTKTQKIVPRKSAEHVNAVLPIAQSDVPVFTANFINVTTGEHAGMEAEVKIPDAAIKPLPNLIQTLQNPPKANETQIKTVTKRPEIVIHTQSSIKPAEKPTTTVPPTTTKTTKTTKTTTTTTTTPKPTQIKSSIEFNSHFSRPPISDITTKRPQKPKISFSADDNPELLHIPRKRLNKFKNPINYDRASPEDNNGQISTELLLDNSGQNNKRRYIIPIVALIFALPLLLGLVNIAIRRIRSYWYTRHYRRMDFLVDGMYNC